MKVYAVIVDFYIKNIVGQRFGMFFIPCKDYIGFAYENKCYLYYFKTKEDAQRALNVMEKQIFKKYKDEKFVDGVKVLDTIKIKGISEKTLTDEQYKKGMDCKPKKVTIAKKDKDYFEGFNLIDVEWI